MATTNKTTRVKPSALVEDAQKPVKTAEKIVKWGFVALLSGALLLFFLGYLFTPSTETRVAASNFSGSGNYYNISNVVSEGPRCDNKLRTIRIDANFQPLRAGCGVSWGINDDSPCNCVVLYDSDSRPLKPVCRGHEQEFSGRVTGWRSAGGVTLVDVIYH